MIRSTPDPILQNTSPNSTRATRISSSTGWKIDGSSEETFCDCHSATETNDPPTIHTSRNNKKRGDGGDQPLPADFVPSCYTVIIGRGKRIAETFGNRRMRVLAKIFLPQYSKATKCKAAKTRIVDKIVDTIKSACADNHCEAAFVRYSKGRCYMVDDSVAREKVGYQLRDLLGDKYESSSKSKVAKKQRLKLQNRKEMLGGDNDDDAVSFTSIFSSNGSRNHEWDENGQTTTTTTISPHSPEFSTAVNDNLIPSHRRPAMKRMSFDAMRLLQQPLIFSRDSFQLMDDQEKTALQESCRQASI